MAKNVNWDVDVPVQKKSLVLLSRNLLQFLEIYRQRLRGSLKREETSAFSVWRQLAELSKLNCVA